MQRHLTSFCLMVCGIVALALGMAVAPAPTPVAAMPALQPSPRPTLAPTPDFIPDDDDDDKIVLFGRITGTVIDTRTGAPAANKRVLVGELLVETDGSGNYDHWLAPGVYDVGLQLGDGEGRASQGMQPVEVLSDATTVMHLFFTSLAPVVADVAPKDAEPTPTAEPTLAPVAQAVVAPVSLPETAAGSLIPGPFLLVGAVLLGIGVLVELRPGRRAARRRGNNRARPSADETLRNLLDREL